MFSRFKKLKLELLYKKLNLRAKFKYLKNLFLQLFDIFLQHRIKQTINRKVVLEFLRMDIKLLKEGNGYSVQISNCGKWNTQHYHTILSIMPQFCAKLILKSEESLFHGEVVYKEDQASLKNSDEGGDTNEFPYLKEYLSVKLKASFIFQNRYLDK